jgi:hypothetical protein
VEIIDMDDIDIEIFAPLPPAFGIAESYVGLTLVPDETDGFVVASAYRAAGQQGTKIHLRAFGVDGLPRDSVPRSIVNVDPADFCLSSFAGDTRQAGVVAKGATGGYGLHAEPIEPSDRGRSVTLASAGVRFGAAGAAAEIACAPPVTNGGVRTSLVAFTDASGDRIDTVRARFMNWSYDPLTARYRLVQAGRVFDIHRVPAFGGAAAAAAEGTVGQVQAIRLTDGRYAVAWSDRRPASAGRQIGVAVLDPAAPAPVRSVTHFAATGAPFADNISPRLAPQWGGFVVAWEARELDGTWRVHVRRVDSAGAPAVFDVPGLPAMNDRLVGVHDTSLGFILTKVSMAKPGAEAMSGGGRPELLAVHGDSTHFDGGLATPLPGYAVHSIESLPPTATTVAGDDLVAVWRRADAPRRLQGGIIDVRGALPIRYGSAGPDYLPGREGGDIIYGRGGDDEIIGRSGDDVLVGGPGADALAGLFGTDTASYEDAPAGVTADLRARGGHPGTGDAAGDRYDSVEHLAGSFFDDVLYGDDLANTIQGGSGRDRLFGRGGDDVLEVGDGAGEQVDGGPGWDVVSYRGVRDGITVDMKLPSANSGAAAGDRWTAIEGVAGGEGDDEILGTDAGDMLLGRGGHDNLRGRGGNDLLDGGAGANELAGAAGADRFRISALAGAHSTVVDFRPHEADRVELAGAAFRRTDGTAAFPNGPLTQVAGALVSGSPPRPSAVSPVLLYDRRTGALSFDPDGTGPAGAARFATFERAPNLGAGNIDIY